MGPSTQYDPVIVSSITSFRYLPHPQRDCLETCFDKVFPEKALRKGAAVWKERCALLVMGSPHPLSVGMPASFKGSDPEIGSGCTDWHIQMWFWISSQRPNKNDRDCKSPDQ